MIAPISKCEKSAKSIQLEKHALTVQVFQLQGYSSFGDVNLADAVLNNGNQRDENSCRHESDALYTQQFLLLPQCPVNIHLGNIFSGCVYFYNKTQDIVKIIHIQVDLLTSSDRECVVHRFPVTLSPDGNTAVHFHHEMKKTGPHILLCEARYISRTGQQMSLRKFFKIEVLEPFYDLKNNNVASLNLLQERMTSEMVHSEKISSRNSHLFIGVNTIILEGVKKLYYQMSTLLYNMTSCFKDYHYQ